MYVLRFDGSFRSTNGFMKPSGFLGYGWIIYYQNTLISYGYGVALRAIDATSNVAEYLALIEGLEAMNSLNLSYHPVCIISDASVIIHRMTGYSSIATRRDRPFHQEVQDLVDPLNIYAWKWIPRRYNRDADSLSRRGIHELFSDRKAYHAALSTIEEHQSMNTNKIHHWDGMELFYRQDYLLYEGPDTAFYFQHPLFNERISQHRSSL